MLPSLPKFLLASTLALSLSVIANAADPPAWAYGIAPPPPPSNAAADTSMKHIAGSTLSFTRSQISNPFGPADWFPGDHPAMPDVVAHGKRPDVRACSLCHYPNGKGRAENAGVADLPVSYFIQQMNDFRSGARASAEPRKGNVKVMIAIARGMTEDEIKQAAEYYGKLKWTPWIKVVEAKMAPKTRINNGLYLVEPGNEKVPLGDQIIETPVDAEQTEILRNPHSGFIAYVPPGSIKRGEALVTKGEGKTVRCAICHGEDLKGMGPVPPLAGRSPSYLVRQMYDMQQGARHGEWTTLMKPVVEKLTNQDMLDIVAYTASRQP
jgi:cytochrome c553